jgi:hypothetical protein
LDNGYITLEYQNQMIMIIKERGEIESKNDTLEEDEMPPLKDGNDIKYPINEEALVIKRSLNIQIKNDNVEQ